MYLTRGDRKAFIRYVEHKLFYLYATKASFLSVSVWIIAGWAGFHSGVIRRAEEQARQSNVQQAFKLYRVAMYMGPANRKAAMAGYWNLVNWFAAKGFLLEAEEQLRLLLPIYRAPKFARRKILLFWVEFAIYDRRILLDTLRWYRGVDDVRLLRKLLRLIFYIDGWGDRYASMVRSTYLRVVKSEPVDAILADYFSICSFLDRPFELDSLRLYDNFFPSKNDIPSVSMQKYFTRGKGFSRSPIKDSFFPLLQYENDSKNIWNLLADKSLTIALVGNSRSLVSSLKGSEIDSHDIVIRFNVPIVDCSYSADVGLRTDIHVVNQDLLCEPRIHQLANSKLIVSGPAWELFSYQIKYLPIIMANGVEVSSVTADITLRLIRLLGASPSSGLQILSAISSVRDGDLSLLNIFGFAGIDQVGRSAVSASYYRKSLPSQRHSWHAEALEVKRLLLKNTGIDTEYIKVRYQNAVGQSDEFRPLLYKFVGDHTDCHCGSAAASAYLKARMSKYALQTSSDDFDWLVVNGEGSMHHDSKVFRDKMISIEKAVENDKRVMLVNTVWQDNPKSNDKVLRGIDRIYVREKCSYEDLKNVHGIDSIVYPDFSYFSDIKNVGKNIKYKNKIVITDCWSKELGAFTRWTGKEWDQYDYVDMKNQSWSELVTGLRSARLLISGSHYAIYAACRAEIPFIAFPGNTHEIEGLLRSASVNIPICTERAKLPEMIEWAEANFVEYQKLFAWLKSFANWDPFK